MTASNKNNNRQTISLILEGIQNTVDRMATEDKKCELAKSTIQTEQNSLLRKLYNALQDDAGDFKPCLLKQDKRYPAFARFVGYYYFVVYDAGMRIESNSYTSENNLIFADENGNYPDPETKTEENN